MLAASLLAALLTPAFVNAGLFPSDSLVKHITAKQFPKIMKENATSVVAFVAPWCGHCKAMAPELSKAALGLYPLVPVYAVDCDDKQNQQLCAREGVKGFPTVKLFPRGKTMAPVVFDGPNRSASAFWYWATRRIPHQNTKLYFPDKIMPWVEDNTSRDRVLLLTKDKKLPVLWQVLANKYRDQFAFGSHRDRKGKGSIALGLEEGGKKESKVLVFPKGGNTFVRFEGILKLDSLSKFLDSVLDGTADLSSINAAASQEEFHLSPEEEEIERRQEAQRIALAHGGFNDLIDFEEAIKKYGKDFHGAHGYQGVMGDMPLKKKENAEGAGAEGEKTDAAPEKKAKKEDPIHKILKHQQEQANKPKVEKPMPMTGGAAEPDATETPVAEAAPTAAKTPVPDVEAAPAAAEEEAEAAPVAEADAPEPEEIPARVFEAADAEDEADADDEDVSEEASVRDAEVEDVRAPEPPAEAEAQTEAGHERAHDEL